MPLHVDRQSLPLLRLSYDGEYSDAELSEFLCELDAALELPGRKVALIDLRRSKGGSAHQRQVQADWIASREPILTRDFAAAAIVTDSTIIRGTVTAVFWIRPLPLPTHVAATMERAEEWLAPYLLELRAR